MGLFLNLPLPLLLLTSLLLALLLLLVLRLRMPLWLRMRLWRMRWRRGMPLLGENRSRQQDCRQTAHDDSPAQHSCPS